MAEGDRGATEPLKVSKEEPCALTSTTDVAGRVRMTLQITLHGVAVFLPRKTG